jgi:hypothetical protein
MTDIRVYRKLRLMQTEKTAGIKVPFNNNKLRILMRHLKALATAEGIDIPRALTRWCTQPPNSWKYKYKCQRPIVVVIYVFFCVCLRIVVSNTYQLYE